MPQDLCTYCSVNLESSSPGSHRVPILTLFRFLRKEGIPRSNYLLVCTPISLPYSVLTLGTI